MTISITELNVKHTIKAIIEHNPELAKAMFAELEWQLFEIQDD